MRYPLSLVLLTLFVSSCSSTRTANAGAKNDPAGSAAHDHSIDSLYSAAIADAKNPEPGEVYRNLTRLWGNPNLIDTTINGVYCILVASWKANSSYYPDNGEYNTGNYDVWVTVAPQVREQCAAYRSFFGSMEEVEMRLRQLLGLQPDNQEKFFLELWVRPEDMFRPCPDNETNDTECGLALPANVDSSYRTWFNNLRAVQYVDCSDTLLNHAGYPWTQLGYTYDWNAENPSHVGLSEFVIRRNATVWVQGKIPTKEYCR